jgi:outer membrane protein assembly factor BamB
MRRSPGASGSLGTPRPAWQSAALDGDVYGSPLVVGGRVLVVTQHDTVYAFDARGGDPDWQVSLGTPVQASTLPCGNIRPESGALSTPVADVDHGLLYVAAFLAPAHHELFTIELAGGRIRDHRTVDPPTDSPTVEQQRGALTLSRGYVYIAYGGLLGDCGSYHGWVVGAPVAGGDLISYKVACGRACGLWAPGGPSLDAAGNLWVASGNSYSETAFDYGNAVIKLSPELKELGYFAPADWAALNRADADLGSISPLPLDASNIWSSGKAGTGYIVSAANPGGIGGQRFAGQLGCGTWSGSAYLAPDLYLACGGALLALRVDTAAPSFTVRWRSTRAQPGAPILAYGALWTIETGSGTLVALDPAGGGLRWSGPIGATVHFVTPAAAGGFLFVVGGRKLQAIATEGTG